jgi:hypothetical protein
MTTEQKRQLHDEITRLVEETQGFEDARQYLGDVATDTGLTEAECLEELKRFFGRD